MAGRDHKRMSFKAMAELLGMPYRTAHFRWSKGYSISESLLTPVGEPKRTSQVKHGMHESPEYAVWESMHYRCRSHPHYLRLGISVCERWSDFEAFYADMGPRPSLLYSIDRYPDGKGNYEPGNCRWATPLQQSQNTNRNVNVTWNGETACVSEWARRVGINEKTIHERLERGWSPEQALSLPAHTNALGKKLTEDEVRWIRANVKKRDPVYGVRPLAAKFGIHEVTMARLVRGEIWRHVP